MKILKFHLLNENYKTGSNPYDGIVKYLCDTQPFVFPDKGIINIDGIDYAPIKTEHFFIPSRSYGQIFTYQNGLILKYTKQISSNIDNKYKTYYDFTRREIISDSPQSDIIEYNIWLKMFEESLKSNEAFQKLYTNNLGRLIAYKDSNFEIALSSDNNPTRISLWHYNINIGNMYLSDRPYKHNGITYTKVSSIQIDKKWRGYGLSKIMYQVALKYITTNGIISYLPDRINKKQIPAIYKKLGGIIDGDYAIINKSK